MKWFYLTFLVFLIACNGVIAEGDVQDAPANQNGVKGNASEVIDPTISPTPMVSGASPLVAHNSVQMSQEECVNALKQNYGTQGWENLHRLSAFSPRLHYGEQACKDEQYYQQVPDKIRLLMYRVETLRALEQIRSLENQLDGLQSQFGYMCRAVKSLPNFNPTSFFIC